MNVKVDVRENTSLISLIAEILADLRDLKEVRRHEVNDVFKEIL